MHLKYGFLADAIVETQGKKNALGIHNFIGTPDFPVNHNLSVLMCVEGKASERGVHQFEFLLVDADHQPLIPPFSGEFEMGANRGSPIISAEVVCEGGVVFRKPGPYEFLVRVDSRHLGSVPFYVVKLIPAS